MPLKRLAKILFLFPVFSSASLIPIETELLSQNTLEVHLVDEKGSIPNAEVLIEDLQGRLVSSGKAASDGIFKTAFRSRELAQGVHITAFSTQHVAVSFLYNTASKVTLTLPQVPPENYIIIDGLLTGFQKQPNNDYAKVGFVAKAFELKDLLQFESTSFISPLDDVVRVFGERKMPSNFVLPDQSFSIYIIPIHLKKPSYRLPVYAGSSQNLTGITTLVDAQGVWENVNKENLWKALNYIKFTNVGVTSKITAPTNPKIPFKLNIVADQPLNETVEVKVEKKGVSNQDIKRVLASVYEPTPMVFVPTDIKYVEKEKIKLKVLSKYTARLLDILVSNKTDHFQATWLQSLSAPTTQLKAELTFQKIDQTWNIKGYEKANLLVAHLEEQKKTSWNCKRSGCKSSGDSTRQQKKWILIFPPRKHFQLPPKALEVLQPKLQHLTHVSLDLIQVASGGYPWVRGENASKNLLVFERVRKPLQ